MELRLALQGDLQKTLDAEQDRLARALRLAADVAGEQVKLRLRKEIKDAGLGDRLANTIRHAVYPRPGRRSLSPVATVFTRAPRIIRGLTEATTIRGSGTNWLAIPSENAPARFRGKRMTPELYEERFGAGRLRFVVTERDRAGVLIDDDLRKRRGKRGGFAPRSEKSRGEAESVIMFFLVREVRTKPKLSLPELEAYGSRLYAENVRAQLARLEAGTEGEAEDFVVGVRRLRREARAAARPSRGRRRSA